jgi:hypothetical protein
MWSEVAEVLSRAGSESDSKMQIPAGAVGELLTLAEEWLRLGDRRVPEKAQVTDEHAEIGCRGGSRMFASLRAHIVTVPGLVFRAQRIVEEISCADIRDFAVDPELVALVGERAAYEREDYDAYLVERKESLMELAKALVALGPVEGVRRLNELMRQSQIGGTHGADSEWLASLLKAHMMDAGLWFRTALAERCRPIALSALEVLLERKEPGVDQSLDLKSVEAGLDDSETRGGVIATVLRQHRLSPAVELVLGKLRAQDEKSFEWVIQSRKQPDPVLLRLLTHRTRAIRSTVAVSFAVATANGPELPSNWNDEWETAVVGLHVDELTSHSQWRAGELLEHLAKTKPILFESWYAARLDEMAAKGYVYPPEPLGSEKWLALMPEVQRERVIRRYAEVAGLRELLSHLLGPDPAFATRLLEEGVVTSDDIVRALLGQRGPLIETLGPLLVRWGISPEKVAASGDFDSSWFGPESGLHRKRLEYFRSLLDRNDPDLARIGAAGVAEQERKLRDTLEDEHQRRVRGQL